MPVNVLFAADADDWEDYQPHLREGLAALGLDFQLSTDLPPEEVDYIIYAPKSKLQDFTPLHARQGSAEAARGVDLEGAQDSAKSSLRQKTDFLADNLPIRRQLVLKNAILD